MDETDGWWIAAGLAAVAAAVLLLACVVKELQSDMELLRVTAAVPEIERHA